MTTGFGRGICMITLSLLAGCGGLPDTAGKLDPMANYNCPVAGCDPGQLNARGIFNVEGGNHCIATPLGMFCPHQFENIDQHVEIVGLINAGVASAYRTHVTAHFSGQPVALLSIRGTASWAIVKYEDPSGIHEISGTDLNDLVLVFFVGATRYEMRLSTSLTEPAQESGVWLYDVSVRSGASPWQSLCTDANGGETRATLYFGATFDPYTAQRTNSRVATTLSCKKGGISACMQLGYAPWQSATNLQTGATEYLTQTHVACIQMKRAAYCGTESYTANGTEIGIRDVFGIQNTGRKFYEATFTPTGAACLNVDHRRRPDILFPGCAKPLPPCPSDEGTLLQLGPLGSSNDVVAP